MTGMIVAADGGYRTLLLTATGTELRVPAFCLELAGGEGVTLDVTAQRRAMDGAVAA
jgi:hypothetical protein